MEKVITLKQAENIIKKLRNEAKTIVLAGGCFDILHLGHIKFLTAAEKAGDVLIVALESDENVKRLKGNGRPINSQKDRAEVLSAISAVDYVLLLPPMENDLGYFNLVNMLRPEIIAVTAGDPHLTKKQGQVKLYGGQVKLVTPLLTTSSTTRLAKILQHEGI